MGSITPPIRELLRFLYGEKVGNEAEGLIRRLLEPYEARTLKSQASRSNATDRSLTQTDALLITYPDQVWESGVRPLASLKAFADKHLRGLISGLHLLPFYPWSSDDGFSVKDYFAVEPSYGTWENIRALGKNFDLMFDGVVNHVSAQGPWFQGFLSGEKSYQNFFITVDGNPDLSQVVRPRTLPLLTEFNTAAGPKKVWTTFSADQVDLNFSNPEVLAKIVEVLLFYVRQGARYIRLDAIAFLWKKIGTPCLHLPQTHGVVQLLRAILDEVAPETLLITETNVPHADNVSYFGGEESEAQLVYNFALPPLVLHSLLTGNAEKLTGWAQSLRVPKKGVTFFNFLASHDGIGLNPVRGILTQAEIDALVARGVEHGSLISYKQLPDGSETPYELNLNYLDALSNPSMGEPVGLAARKFLVAQAIMLCLAGVPGIYFHSLFGSRGDRAGALACGIKRRINREKLQRDRLEAELGDAPSLRSHIFSGYKKLLKLRHSHAAFAPASAQRILDLDPRLFAVLREAPHGDDRMLCVHNVSNESCTVKGLALGPYEFVWSPWVGP